MKRRSRAQAEERGAAGGRHESGEREKEVKSRGRGDEGGSQRESMRSFFKEDSDSFHNLIIFSFYCVSFFKGQSTYPHNGRLFLISKNCVPVWLYLMDMSGTTLFISSFLSSFSAPGRSVVSIILRPWR